MSRRPNAIALVLTLTTAVACASTSTPNVNADPSRVLVVDANGTVVRQTSDESARASFAATPDRVWPALLSAYAALGIQPTINDRATGRYGNAGFLAPRRINGIPLAEFFACGNGVAGPLIDTGRLTADVVTTIAGAADGTTLVVTRVNGALRRNDGTSTDPLRCGSTGKLEEMLRRTMERRLGILP